MRFANMLAICATCVFALPAFAEADQAGAPDAASGPALQTASAVIPPPAQMGSPGRGLPQPGGASGMMPGPDFRGPHPGGDRPEGPPEVHAALATIDEIQRLYVETGRAAELPAFYHGVLAKTHDPMLRTIVYHRLADAELKPAHADDAIATLRTSLDETLTRLDSMAPAAPNKH